jgi:hypothetical protein
MVATVKKPLSFMTANANGMWRDTSSVHTHEEEVRVMELTEYGFKNAVGAFFEMPTSDARKILPSHLQPLEVQHERSILAITAFQFTESMVGEYDEVVMSVIVPPMMEAGRPLPKAAFYPFMVGVTTDASREHAIERWHLPHYMKNLQMEFAETDDELSLSISDEGQPVLELSVTNFPGAPETVLFNAFTVDEENRFKVNIFMDGQHTEHEEEAGSLTLHPHEMTKALTLDDISSVPFREQWFHGGLQTFEELERI